MKAIEKTLEYHELLMVMNDLSSIVNSCPLPEGYSFSFWKNEEDTSAWVDIHLSSGEFTSKERARYYFYTFYEKFLDELCKRCFFIEYKGVKIATATISPANEYGYKCVIDWLAISKEHQGKKLSKPLIHKCFCVAKDLGYSKVLLHTQTHTWLAAKLYLDLGFEPFNMAKNLRGWQILKTITNHPKLAHLEPLRQEDMYEPIFVNVVTELKKLHSSFTYEIWNTNNKNDVYVNENGRFYHYKFLNNGKRLEVVTS